MCSRVKEIDWIPFLTNSLIDDAASHLRLYRTALNKVKSDSNRDLLSEFFDLEASMEKNLCRDMVCIDDTHLEGSYNITLNFTDRKKKIIKVFWFIKLDFYGF